MSDLQPENYRHNKKGQFNVPTELVRTRQNEILMYRRDNFSFTEIADKILLLTSVIIEVKIFFDDEIRKNNDIKLGTKTQFNQ